MAQRAVRRWLVFGAAVTLVAVWIFAGITGAVVGKEELSSGDPTVAAWLAAHRTDGLTRCMRVATWLGSGWVTVPVLTAGALLLPLWQDRRRTLVLVATLSAGTVALVTVGKLLTVRPRPVVGEVPTAATGYAYPSGHSAQAATAYGVLALLVSVRVVRGVKPLVWLVATVVVLLVGFSRMYLGVHWLTDVLAGYALGVGWLVVVVAGGLAHDRLRAGPRPRVNV